MRIAAKKRPVGEIADILINKKQVKSSFISINYQKFSNILFSNRSIGQRYKRSSKKRRIKSWWGAHFTQRFYKALQVNAPLIEALFITTITIITIVRQLWCHWTTLLIMDKIQTTLTWIVWLLMQQMSYTSSKLLLHRVLFKTTTLKIRGWFPMVAAEQITAICPQILTLATQLGQFNQAGWLHQAKRIS